MSAGFYKRRRGVLEHLESGKIGLLDLAIHDYLCLKINGVVGTDCSIPPGICFSSAVAIHAMCPRELSERTIRRSLEHLEKIGWIKRWQERGRRGNYPILVCRASVHDVSAVEYRVNGLETTDWRNPILIPAALSPHSRPMLSGYREKRVEIKKNSNPAAKHAPPADPRHRPFVDFAYKSYKAKHGIDPIWRGKDFSAIKRLLQDQSVEKLPLDRLIQLWTNYTSSTEGFTAKQCDSLAYFCSNVDKFLDGPLLAVTRRGTNAKPSVSDNMRTTLAAFRATEPKPVN